jgi:hypothetical protein
MNVLKHLLPDAFVEKRYLRAGNIFGCATSCSPVFGECTTVRRLLRRWGRREREYARRGYRTISLDAFIDSGGWGEPIDHLAGQKRVEGEHPIFHAEIYRTKYLGRVKPVLNINRLKGGEEL